MRAFNTAVGGKQFALSIFFFLLAPVFFLSLFSFFMRRANLRVSPAAVQLRVPVSSVYAVADGE